LGNYGGPTQTMPPLASSPVIDAGGDTYLAGISTDQTGAPRMMGAHVDIGAVELPVGSVVVNNADSGYGSLRYVSTYVSSGANITFSPGLAGQTIMVTHGEIPVNKNLSISALGLTGGIVLNGSHSNRLFNVSGGVTATLDSLTLTNGYAGTGKSGGAIE